MERILDFLLSPQNLGRVSAKSKLLNPYRISVKVIGLFCIGRRKSSTNKSNRVGRKKAKLSSSEEDGTEEEADSEGEIEADSEVVEEEEEEEEEEEGEEEETLEETKEQPKVLPCNYEPLLDQIFSVPSSTYMYLLSGHL